MYKIYYTIGYGFNHHYPNYRRWLMRVNLTCVILLLAFLQIATAAKAQRISLSKKNAALTEVFKEIRKQSGYDFVYPKDLLKQAKTVSLTVSNVSLNDVLVKCFEGQPFTYKVENKTIVVSEKKPSIIDKVIDYFSAIDVRGKVMDERGAPLPGATVKVKGTGIATVTNEDGEFFLKGVSEDAVIVIAYLGYKPLELKVSLVMGEIKLELAPAELGEVKISGGYYETTDKLKTGSIVKVIAKDIENQPVTSPLMALQGRVPGLDIVPTDGTPGSAPVIRIRGMNSLRNTLESNGNLPLYVIDGVPVSSNNVEPTTSGRILGGIENLTLGYDPLSTINPANIESIEVLKDGDATAIYGSRGANGVILITTKRGKNKSGRTNFDLNIYKGMGQLSKKAELLSTQDYVNMRKEAFSNDGLQPSPYDSDVLYWDTTRYTDWQDVLLGGTSNISDVRSSISFGSKNTSFTVGGGYHKETLIFPGDFGTQRINGNVSIDHASSDNKFKLAVVANYGMDISDFFLGGSMVYDAITLPPNAPQLYNASNDLNWEMHNINGVLTSTWVNPMSYLKRTQNKKTLNLITNATASYEFIPGLSLITNIGYSNLISNDKSQIPISALAPDAPNQVGSARFSDTKRSSWIIEPRLAFTKKITDHTIDIIFGTTLQESTGSIRQVLGGRYRSDALLNSLTGAGDLFVIADEFSEYKFSSLYSRVGYNFRSKYLLNITGRRDGSSRFGPGNQFGNFWAVGSAWIFTGEDFLKNALSFLNFGKLRASYGLTGSDNIGDYNYYNLYTPGNETHQGIPGFSPSALFNPEFAWEETRKLEAAMEVVFFENRISGEINWYRNRSSNQLVQYTLPATTGFPSVLENFDATIQNTGWEFSLRGEVFKSAAWHWNIAGNITLPDNKLLKFDGIEDSPYATVYKVGEPLSIQWLYKSNGVNPLTGQYEVEDRNKDGIINNLDRALVNLRGRKIYGGLNNTIQYKSFELSFLLQFARQKQPSHLTILVPGFIKLNMPKDVLQRWREAGDHTSIAKYSTGASGALRQYLYIQESDGNITDASFIRLKTLSLSYSIPATWLEKIKLSQLRIFLQGQNLLTLTKYKGTDPETAWGSLPPLRMVTAGLQLKL